MEEKVIGFVIDKTENNLQSITRKLVKYTMVAPHNGIFCTMEKNVTIRKSLQDTLNGKK